jgi:mRNA interferase MazF
LRVDVEPTADNGLKQNSKVMVDKLYAVPAHRIHQHVGVLDGVSMHKIDRALLIMFDLDPMRPTHLPD